MKHLLTKKGSQNQFNFGPRDDTEGLTLGFYIMRGSGANKTHF